MTLPFCTADYVFTDGYDKYGAPGSQLAPYLFLGEWTGTYAQSNSNTNLALVSGLVRSGGALRIFTTYNAGSGGGDHGLFKVLPASYGRAIGGTFVMAASVPAGPAGVRIVDSGTPQVSIGVNSSGNVQAKRGRLIDGALLGTSVAVVPTGSIFHLGWDVLIHPTAGFVKIYINGALDPNLSLTGINTRASANSTFNEVHFAGSVSGNTEYDAAFDHTFWWCYLPANVGAVDVCPQTLPTIETQFPSSDVLAQFTAAAGILGDNSYYGNGSSAPGANQLVLRRYTPAANATLNSVSIWPVATSAGANVKAVLYNDSAGAPHTLLATGTQVTGLTSQVECLMPFAAGQALTAGTAYWIGYITDTSVAINIGTADLQGFTAANTYGSGAPASNPAMTGGKASWTIYGRCTSIGANFPQVAVNPPQLTSTENTFNASTASLGYPDFNQGAAAGLEDLFGFPAITTPNPQNVYAIALKILVQRVDSGGRTITLQTKSGATDSSGSLAAAGINFTPTALGSYWVADPNGGAAWTPTAVNAAPSGYKIVT